VVGPSFAAERQLQLVRRRADSLGTAAAERLKARLDVEAVVETSAMTGMVRSVARLRPQAVIKG